MKTNRLKFSKIFLALLCSILCFSMGFLFTNLCTSKGVTTTNVLANYDLDEMLSFSDLIIEGRVKSVSEPFWDKENKDIVRRSVTVEVNDTYKGKAKSTVELLLSGGKIGDYVHNVSPNLELIEGENVILFLIQYHDNEHYVIMNSTQGVLYAEKPMNNSDEVVYSTAENYNFKFNSITRSELRQYTHATKEE